LQKKLQLQDEAINFMYNVEKHVNPHDIAGQPGIVKAQSVELEKKKV